MAGRSAILKWEGSRNSRVSPLTQPTDGKAEVSGRGCLRVTKVGLELHHPVLFSQQRHDLKPEDQSPSTTATKQLIFQEGLLVSWKQRKAEFPV